MRTAIPWEERPEPWRSIGPRLKAEVEAICAAAAVADYPLRDRPERQPHPAWRYERPQAVAGPADGN